MLKKWWNPFYCRLLLKAVRSHRDQRGDDRCWMDDYDLYDILPEGINGRDLRLNSPEELHLPLMARKWSKLEHATH